MSQTPVRDPARTAADTGMLQTLEWRHSTPSSMVRTAAPLSRVVGHNLGGFTRILQAAELVQPSRHRSIQRLGGPDQKLNLESQGFSRKGVCCTSWELYSSYILLVLSRCRKEEQRIDSPIFRHTGL